ncbi:hypothetical protein UlMin_036432 [Ulmus minor]
MCLTEKVKKSLFLEHGGKLLEEILASCKGKCNPIRSFSAEELHKATNGFSTKCYSYEFDWYKGILDDQRPVLVKTYNKKFKNHYDGDDGAYRDIAISSLMSGHNNVLKLLGCCQEFPSPMLVYQYAGNGPLNTLGSIGSDGSALPWKMRLKVAKEIANALTYLHTAFTRPIIHRDIKPTNVLLDEDFVAKLSSFQLSISVPEGKTVVEDMVTGTYGFIDPIYYETKCVNEQSDVYSFGVFLLVLLTGQSAWDSSLPENSRYIPFYITHMVEEERFNEIVDSKILEEGGGIIQEQQLQAFTELALRCTKLTREDRPLMIDVAKELRRIERLVLSSAS